MSDAPPMSDHDLIQALERQGGVLTERGLTLRATEAQRAAGTLSQSAKEHQSAVNEGVRCQRRAESPKALPEDATAAVLAQTAIQLRSANLSSCREHAHRVLSKHR